MRKLLISLLVLSFLAPACSAAPGQSIYQRLTAADAVVLYDAERTTLVPGAAFWLHGGTAEVALNRWYDLWIVGDFAGSHNAKISPSGVSLDLVTITAGPQFKWTAPSRPDYYNATLFGHLLVGEAHAFNGAFAGTASATSSSTCFALKAGGGVDLDISPRVSLRVIQLDWLRTQFPNGANDVQNHIQLGAGVVIHLR